MVILMSRVGSSAMPNPLSQRAKDAAVEITLQLRRAYAVHRTTT
jgi:hypothetical protein